MSFRRLALCFFLLSPFALASDIVEGIGPFAGPEADAEAARLYARANDYVTNVTEGRYSYAYVQFHWKRASANLDRIARTYPTSPTAAKLKAGALLGTYDPTYFKNRVLPRLEEKKVASFDAINCAIFLYYLDTNRDAAGKQALLASIVQTLCRQTRWGEALSFPVVDTERPWLWNEVARQAAIYNNDKLVGELLRNSPAKNQPQLRLTIAEALAFRGDSLAALDAFLKKEGDTPALRGAIFAGLLRRALPVQRAQQLQQPLKGLYSDVDGIQNPERPGIDLPAYLQTIPAGPERDTAQLGYARHLAALGQLDAARAQLPARQHGLLAASAMPVLVANQDITGALALPAKLGVPANQVPAYHLALLEQVAIAGLEKEIPAVRALLPATHAVDAAYHEFRGRMLSTVKSLVVREHVFAELPINDPNRIGRLICEWSLTPNRALRGAAPWDAVVYKFAPGFVNLPPPKDKKKVEAAGR